jgi:chromosome segregation and condensation protein ScpB
MYLKTENSTQSSEKSNDFLKKLYEVIVKAGRKGINYRQIIKIMGIKGEEKVKYENYLLSHYTRKLVNYGLVVVNNKSQGNNPNLKVAYCKKYFIPNKRKN